MKENVITGILSVLIAGVSAYFKIIAVPLVVLVSVMLLDYLSGMTAAWLGRGLSCRKGISGIIKKIGYLVLVCVGIGVDFIIRFCLEQIGVAFEIKMLFGLIVVIWLIINELLSIMENLSRIGVPVPKWLTKIIDKLKISVESKADDNTK